MGPRVLQAHRRVALPGGGGQRLAHPVGAAAAALGDRALHAGRGRTRSTHATVPSRRSIRSGATARRSRGGCGCRTVPTIDARSLDRWDFPAGTRFWKEFRFGGRKVETRFLRRNGDGSWTFASYAWNEAQTDAILAPADGLPNVAEIAPGKFHSIPAVTDCRACHDADGPEPGVGSAVPGSSSGAPSVVSGFSRTQILGFSALQLSTDRDPGAPHAEPLADDMMTLRTLADEHVLEPARPELVAAPPRIPAPDARTRSVLGYLSTNCGSCHNQDSSIANLGLLLKASVAPSHLRTGASVGAGFSRLVGQQTSKWQIPNVPEAASQYVTPGTPELSAILVRMKSRRPSTQMPPLGTVLHDKEAIALVTEWIESLTAQE